MDPGGVDERASALGLRENAVLRRKVTELEEQILEQARASHETLVTARKDAAHEVTAALAAAAAAEAQVATLQQRCE
eukprot:3779376-Prymnesium_polylepis.1